MSTKVMNEEQFDALWQQAAVEACAKRLATQYPQWLARRRRNTGIALAMVAVAALAIPLARTSMQPLDDSYLMAYCNKKSIDESHWVDLANDLLVEDMTSRNNLF